MGRNVGELGATVERSGIQESFADKAFEAYRRAFEDKVSAATERRTLVWLMSEC